MSKEITCKPFFDSILLFCLLKELKNLEGKKIQAVKRDEDNNLYICFAGEMLFYSMNPSLYRVQLIPGKPPRHLDKHPFEAHTRSLRITEVGQLGIDRIFYLGLSQSGIHPSCTLVFELTGPSSNAFLIDENAKVIASLRSSKTKTKGQPYQVDNRDFDELKYPATGAQLSDLIATKTLKTALRNQFKKMPTWLDILSRTKNTEMLRVCLEKVLKKPKPYLHYEESQPCFISPCRISSQSSVGSSFSSAIAELYQHFLLGDQRERTRQQILKKIRNLQKIQENLALDQKEADLSGEFKKKGEIILLYIKKIRKGDRTLTVPDPYDRERVLTIELDPAKSAAKNAAQYYRRARKAQKSKETIQQRMVDTSSEIKRLTNLYDSIETLDYNSVIQILEGFVTKKTKRKGREVPKPFRSFTTISGKKILIGRNKQENEHLTFHVAKPNDLFFHVREAPGSHTILVDDGNISKADIEEAAALAAHFSKAKHSSIVPVSYTQRRYVRKSKKLGPGKVTLSNEKTVFVQPTPPPKKAT